ncbi:cyclic nucleotide-binding domain-containing protein [Terasakiella sp. A23]|uniref:Crp/Fnr family transcriptional regulator n=1 Tax=Terasakiella sp. FCG-A23 TaxID=3080561 RepID=UPI0029540F3D|nr:cyclic nucleotide-binding domain-containing protein [Terasakiella sp. A23]MDV7340760.1 cyclic nucleotide-binding domain-containing protein [Terasakiella sp. A23]
MKREVAFSKLKAAMGRYWVLSDATFDAIKDICHTTTVKKNEHLLHFGDVPKSFYFICQGLVRTYTLGGEDQDKEITENFFEEGKFPASVIALLQQAPSAYGLQALEDSDLIVIDHAKYRSLLDQFEDLKSYHIQYIEMNWIQAKGPREISLMSEDSLQRYRNFMAQNPHLVGRVKLHHIASCLGITPTQLSRIRKEHNL